MPAKSGKQFRFMSMIAHGGKSNKSDSKDKSDSKGKPVGPSKEVAEEMVHKAPAKKRSMFMKKKK